MVVDFRAYTLKVGSVAAFLELFQKEGLEPQQRILGNFMGLYRTPRRCQPNHHDVRLCRCGRAPERRAALYKDPAFAAYLVKARAFIDKQEVRLLVPAACNPCIEGVSL